MLLNISISVVNMFAILLLGIIYIMMPKVNANKSDKCNVIFLFRYMVNKFFTHKTYIIKKKHKIK